MPEPDGGCDGAAGGTVSSDPDVVAESVLGVTGSVRGRSSSGAGVLDPAEVDGVGSGGFDVFLRGKVALICLLAASAASLWGLRLSARLDHVSGMQKWYRVNDIKLASVINSAADLCWKLQH